MLHVMAYVSFILVAACLAFCAPELNCVPDDLYHRITTPEEQNKGGLEAHSLQKLVALWRR